MRYALHVVERAASQIARRFPGRARARELYVIGTFALYRAARDFRDELSHDFATTPIGACAGHARRAAGPLEARAPRARRVEGRRLFLATYRDDDFNIQQYANQ